MSVETAKKVSRHFLGFGESLSKMFPSLAFHLEQSNIRMDEKEWLGLAFFVALVYGAIFFLLIFGVMLSLSMLPVRALGVGFGVGAGLGASMYFYFAFYPSLHAKKKVKDLEQNLPYGLNHLLIQVRAGVTLFNAMVSISTSGYGALSEEFKKAVAEVGTGKSEIDALEQMAIDNPSLHFRRIIWQMVNALKSGADIGNVLKEIVMNIASEQKTAIKKYGSELNPLSLFYMMLVVIFPTMGIVFLLVLFSFVGAAIDIEIMLISILALMFFVQIMFVGLIKNKRPIGL